MSIEHITVKAGRGKYKKSSYTCSRCGDVGHDRRICPIAEADVVAIPEGLTFAEVDKFEGQEDEYDLASSFGVPETFIGAACDFCDGLGWIPSHYSGYETWYSNATNCGACGGTGINGVTNHEISTQLDDFVREPYFSPGGNKTNLQVCLLDGYLARQPIS